jgi:alcohol dehydrogenase class IV
MADQKNKMNTFNAPSAIITGGGSSAELPALIRRLGAGKVLFVTDSFIANTGLIQKLSQDFSGNGISASIFNQVQPDPTVQNVVDGLRALRQCEAEVIVAVGGGSAIDAAKAIAIMATNPEPLSQYMGYHKIPEAGLPLIAVPTTAGTGSEVSKVAVITDTERNVKMMILDQHLLPTIAVVDYALTLSMPAPLTAHVGVDTLTHGMEAYVSRKANALTDPIALSCIKLVSDNLYLAWSEPDNPAAREGMALAACQGGMAFSNSSVCLVHGMSRPLGVQFHLPHGLSNAVLLPAVTRFSVSGALERYATISRTMGFARETDSDEAAARALVAGLETFNASLKIPGLRDCPGMDPVKFEKVLEQMAHDALASGSPQNNPVVPTVEEIIRLYKEAW